MKILLLNLYYPPDTSATAKIARAVVDSLASAHPVTVVCGRPSYDPSERHPWRLWASDTMGLCRIVRVGSTSFPRFNMNKRVVNYLSYAALAVPYALLVDCDIVLAMTDPPFQGILGAWVAMLKRKPYVYNIRDLYPDMAVGGSLVKPGRLTRGWERLHRWALRRAAKVIVLGEDMRARILAKGVEPGRLAVIRDGAEIRSVGASPPTCDAEVVRAIRGDFSFVLLHAGNLGFYGAWSTLIVAARELANHGVGLVFVGHGAQRAEIQAEAAGAGNVRFLDYFPADKIPSVLEAADAHIVTVKRGLEGVVVPSKMYALLAAGKPIVAVAAKETDVVSLGVSQGFAVHADPDQPAELVRVIHTLLSDMNKLRTMGDAARSAAPAYDRVKELQKFSQLIDEIAGQ